MNSQLRSGWRVGTAGVRCSFYRVENRSGLRRIKAPDTALFFLFRLIAYSQ